jgi:hypothetical protein
MIKWFAYIVVLLIFAPCLLFAKIKNDRVSVIPVGPGMVFSFNRLVIDTTTTKNAKKQEPDDKKKIKEVTKAKKQPKPEKLDAGDNANPQKPKDRPKRQRRPEGLERPPEIPRRNGN